MNFKYLISILEQTTEIIFTRKIPFFLTKDAKANGGCSGFHEIEGDNEYIYLMNNEFEALDILVLFHELTHATGRSKRLNRKCYELYHQSKFEAALEEMVAEVTAIKVFKKLGLDTRDRVSEIVATIYEEQIYNSEYITNLKEHLPENVSFDEIMMCIECKSDDACEYILEIFLDNEHVRLVS